MAYIKTPTYVKYKQLTKKSYSLSPYSYKIFDSRNTNYSMLKDLIVDNTLTKGEEVGSTSYTRNSHCYFMRTKTLQEDFLLPVLDDQESIVPILPSKFKSLNITKGDILLSKDANIGEAGYVTKDLSNHTLSGGLYKFRIINGLEHYVFAFVKNSFFKEQVYNMTSKGATIKHAKDKWLKAKIPYPNQANKEDVIKYISLLMKAAIQREEKIKEKHRSIIELIDLELKNNQNNGAFDYVFPRISNMLNSYRIDAGFYCEELLRQQYLIENYSNGFNDFSSSGFRFKRGQNLQVSQIGKSIYSDVEEEGFYKLIRPLNLTNYGTVGKYEYLGNPNKLKEINPGEIVFSAEGSIGKFHVFIDVDKKTITNIHGITIYNESNNNITESIFIGNFLSYLKNTGVLDYISVGGQGGSLAQKYWKHLKFPNFPYDKKEEIARYYYNQVEGETTNIDISNFEKNDEKIIIESGILQLDKQLKEIKKEIDKAVYNVAMDQEVIIDFSFFKKLL